MFGSCIQKAKAKKPWIQKLRIVNQPKAVSLKGHRRDGLS
jgi:hypothetical protein